MTNIAPHVDEICWDVSPGGLLGVISKTEERERLVVVGLREWVRRVESDHTGLMRNAEVERWQSKARSSERQVETLRRKLKWSQR